MITCNRCGKLTYEGLANCQHCGTPLSGKIGSGVEPKMGAPELPELPELPAWLESLRAGERPVASTGGGPNFSTADFVDKDALPSWMRPESAESISGDQQARRRASMPASNTDGGFPPPEGIVASSLIDEQSLPSWLQENSSLSQERNISAASLVQPDALPEWMRTLQQQSGTPAPPPMGIVPPSASAISAMPTEYAIPPQEISANSLIDPQAVPAWLAKEPGQAGPSPISAMPTEYAIPPQEISANSLIDPQAVPAWLAKESGQAGLNELTPAGGQPSIVAASLLDMNALPKWLRESEQEQKPVRTEMTAPAGPGQTHSTNDTLAAPSLIDVNALPDWLRAGSDVGQSGPSAAPAAGRGWNVPPRVENVRVPSRPRGEMGTREQSEVAANVFASMLGVTSPAPYFPAQSPANATGSSPRPGQPQQAMPQRGSVAPGTQPGVAGPGYPPGGYQRSDPTGNLQPAMPQQRPVNPPGTTGSMEANARSGKRGILATILSWFSH